MAVGFEAGTGNSYDLTIETGAPQDITDVPGGSGSDRWMLAAVNLRNTTVMTLTGLSYNSIAMSSLSGPTTSVQHWMQMFGLENPATGNNTLTVDPAAGIGGNISCVSVMVFNGVDSIDTAATPTTDVDDNVEITVSSAADDMAAFMFGWRDNAPDNAEPNSASYTKAFVGVNGETGASGGYAAGAATVNFVADITVGIDVVGWVAMGVNLNAAAGAAGQPSEEDNTAELIYRRPILTPTVVTVWA